MNKLSILQKGFTAMVLLAGIQTVAQAGTLMGSVGNDALNFNVDQNIIGPLFVDASYMHNYRNDNDLATAGAHLDAGLGPIGAMLGVKYFYANVSGQDGHGIAPGVGVSFSPLPLITFSGKYYYSNPDYSEGDIDHYRDWSATANFHPLKFTNFFVGYGEQVIDTKKTGNIKVYDGVFGGVSVSF